MIVIFDLTNLNSFKNTRTWIKSVRSIAQGQAIPMVLVGNNSHLEPQRRVSAETAKKFADEHGIRFFEVSSYTDEGLTDMLDDIMKQVYECKIEFEKLNPQWVEE